MLLNTNVTTPDSAYPVLALKKIISTIVLFSFTFGTIGYILGNTIRVGNNDIQESNMQGSTLRQIETASNENNEDEVNTETSELLIDYSIEFSSDRSFVVKNNEVRFQLPLRNTWRLYGFSSDLMYMDSAAYRGMAVKIYKKLDDFNLEQFMEQHNLNDRNYVEVLSQTTEHVATLSADYDNPTFGPLEPNYISGTEVVEVTNLIANTITSAPGRIIQTDDYVIVQKAIIGCEGECISPNESEINDMIDIYDTVLESLVLYK